MSFKLLLPAFLFISLLARGQAPASGEDLIRKMYSRYTGKWYTQFTFSQTTRFFRNDSLKGSQIWHEAISYPDNFRIDFGESDSGNAVIFKGDSVYRFRNSGLISTRHNDDDLTFLLGGMYFYPLAETLEKYRKLGYRLDKFHEDRWKGKPVWVLGAGSGDTRVSQLWFDKENLFLVRMLNFSNGRKEEGIFDDHIALGGGWSETKATFFFNDKLVQEELYHDCKANTGIDMKIFDPAVFIKRP
jgi:hypothetical protein